VGKYILSPQFGAAIIDVTFNMNLDKWNSLPKDVQDVMTKLSPAYEELNMKLISEAEIKEAKELTAKGNILYKLTPDALQQWKDIIAPSSWNDYISELEAKGLPGREAFNKLVEAAKKYEKNPKWPDPF
jgi:TRAP-type C4-dicarboxylate transport system substrate-binding protein